MKPYQFLPILLCALVACNSSNNNNAMPSLQAPPTLASIAQLPGAESFDSFNTRFHTDADFQRSRIPFPIAGQLVNDQEDTHWSEQNWEFLQTPVSTEPDTTGCRHSLIASDSLVTEKFWIDQSGFKVERRFRLQAGKWFLVYYDDINM